MLVCDWLLPVGAPGHVDHAVAVLLQHLALPELHQLRVKLPDDHCRVFAPCRQVPGDNMTSMTRNISLTHTNLPLGDHLQYQTSSPWSMSTWMVSQGKVSLEQELSVAQPVF